MDSDEAAFQTFVQNNQAQLTVSGVPSLFWASLFLKLKNGLYDAGQSFSFERYEAFSGYKQYTWKVVVSGQEGIKAVDPMNIFIIDHAWTYRLDSARQQLDNIPGFLDRMSALMDLATVGETQEEITEDVLKESWKYCQFYKISGAELGTKEALPIWYLLDEFGSRIQHSDEPSFACVPFIYQEKQLSYSLLWPLKDLAEGDEVTRDYAYGVPKMDQKQRDIALLPWFPKDYSSISFEQEDPGEVFFSSFHNEASLPEAEMCTAPQIPEDRIMKVFTDEALVKQCLTDDKFEIVETAEEADIIWMQKAIKTFREMFMCNQYVQLNQFPGELVLNCKDLMALVGRRVAPPGGPKWLATTYNLKTEREKFVAYYQHRNKLDVDNTWICKTWNLARSVDMQVSDDLNCILRVADTGPKIAVKYIHDGVLFDRPEVGLVKFDLRYNILVTSLKPLKIYTQQVFWIRVANKPFSLDHFDDFEKHFTVMNYGDEELKQVHSNDFVQALCKQYPDQSWDDTEARIDTAFVELFTSAASKDPPMGMMHVDNCRGFYGVDIMLTWKTNDKGEQYMQPTILEVNLAGDNKRCLTYHPDFYNATFRLLFRGEKQEDTFRELKAIGRVS